MEVSRTDGATRRILLWDLPDEILLILEHPSGVSYHNQVGGIPCWEADIEGVLCPLDVSPEATKLIQECAYPSGRGGITVEIADRIDEILASGAGTRFMKVNPQRLDDSWEAWVYVIVETPKADAPAHAGPNFGPARGFGTATGVLTWPNSD